MLADGAGGVEDVKLPSNVNAVPELMGHAVLKLLHGTIKEKENKKVKGWKGLRSGSSHNDS